MDGGRTAVRRKGASVVVDPDPWVLLERRLLGEIAALEPYGYLAFAPSSRYGAYLQLIHSRRGMIGIEVNQPLTDHLSGLPVDVVARLEVLGFEADHERTFQCFRHVVLPRDWDERRPSDRTIPRVTAAQVAYVVVAALRHGLQLPDARNLGIERSNTGQSLDGYWFEDDDQECE